MRTVVTGIAVLSLAGCSLLPSEFNLSPFYRHRLAEDGTVLEMDVLWPVIHYETLPDGGTDFRIRPFYRRVERPTKIALDATATKSEARQPTPTRRDHQFLWPLGRVRTDDTETHARLFPLWNYDGRTFNDGRFESDWYFLFPFIWGGHDKKPGQPGESYFGVFPLWLDAPGQFLTYDRFTVHLWPLHLRTEKDGRIGHVFLWPFIGYGYSEKEEQTWWRRFLPFFNVIVREGHFARYSVLWPFFSWGTDLLHTDDPLKSFNFWPLFGWQTSEKVNSWSFLWPFFRGQEIKDKKFQLDLLWPFFHWLEDDTSDEELKTWWFWPFVSRTTSKFQRTWSILWPFIWWREYDDPDGRQNQEWVVPFYKHLHRDRADGGEDDYLQIWPLFHVEENHDGTGDWAFPSPWFYRNGNEEGVGEAYDWAYTIARGRSRGPDDHSTELAANLYTTRTRGEQTWSSVPFLYSCESQKGKGGTFYLFNCIPIPFGTSAEENN